MQLNSLDRSIFSTMDRIDLLNYEILFAENDAESEQMEEEQVQLFALLEDLMSKRTSKA